MLNDSGLGQTYQTTEKLRILIYVVFILMLIWKCRNQHFYVNKKDFITIMSMSLIFILVSFFKGNGLMGLHYVTAFILIYVIGNLPVKKSTVKIVGILYLILGLSILFIYNFSSILSGWNGNTIGMCALYSFLFYLISYYGDNRLKSKAIVVVMTLLYIGLVGVTDSRSSIIFAVIALMVTFSILPSKYMVKTDERYYFWLVFPLIITIGVILISQGSYMSVLNTWSIKEFGKPIFNGRDELWEKGLEILSENLLFGRGDLRGNWHNCIITLLTAFGIIGTFLWIKSIQRILKKGRNWIKDPIVEGCIITFIITLEHQSVELGMISENPNLLPYIALGIMLGRVKLLDEHENRLKEI